MNPINKEEFASGIAEAFSADLERAPSILEAIDRGIGSQSLQNIVLQDLARWATGSPAEPLFPNLRAFVQSHGGIDAYKQAVGLAAAEAGTDYSFIGSIVGALTTVVSTVVNVRTQAQIIKAQKDAVDAQVRAAEFAAKQAQAQITAQQMAVNAQEKVEAGKPAFGITVSNAALPVGIAAVVLVGGYLVLKG